MLQTSTSEASGCSSSPGVSVLPFVKWARPAYRTPLPKFENQKASQQPVLGCCVTLEFTPLSGLPLLLVKGGGSDR